MHLDTLWSNLYVKIYKVSSKAVYTETCPKY